MKRKSGAALALLWCTIALTGCEPVMMLAAGGLAGGAGGYFGRQLLQPVAGFAVADATTALAWINQEEKAGRLSPDKATQARVCPDAVVQLDTAKQAATQEPTIEGKKGLIFLGTVRKYGPDHDAEIQQSLSTILSACRDLVPVGQGRGLSILSVFGGM